MSGQLSMEDAPRNVRTGHYLGWGFSGFHRLVYREWGEPKDDHVTLCVHGLTRNSRDFDPLASILSKDRHVVCPDVVGRGDSDWLKRSIYYDLPQYNADMNALIARLGVTSVDWIGTSMGGLIGMVLASMPGTPIKRLILNDIGAFIPSKPIRRLRKYVGTQTVFETFEEAEAHIREIYHPFGPMSDEDWKRMAKHSYCPSRDGRIMAKHDPAIGNNFQRFWPFMGISYWNYWDKIKCPVLVLRGTESDFLLRSTVDDMLARGPGGERVEFEGVGHAPTLNAQEQIDPIVDWLKTTDRDAG